MKLLYKGNPLNSLFALTDHYQDDREDFSKDKGLISMLWNRHNEEVKMIIDGIPIYLAPHQILTTTYFQVVEFPSSNPPLVGFTFNREFYCINDNDHEVSCNGIIFFGTQNIPVINLDQEHQRKVELLFQVFIDEFKTRDDIQGEMLQMLLKRLIIICTRLARKQHISRELNNAQVDIVRQFNVLVDVYYKSKKQVGDYAEMLNKSPKTLSNLFSVYNQKSPLQVIHERIILEAKRLLLYTDKTAKEIAYELGFDDVAHFNKMFKKITSTTPTAFKKETEAVV